MTKITLILILLLCSLNADTKLFLAFSINDSASLKQLDEALSVGLELRQTIKTLEDRADSKENLKVLKEKLAIYEKQMHKTYGLYPGLTYKMTPTSGYIFNFIPLAEGTKHLEPGFDTPLKGPTTLVKNRMGKDVECYKVKINFIQGQQSVLEFNKALNTALSIRQQIDNIEKQLMDKPKLKQHKKIQEAMTVLRETLRPIQKKLEEIYGVKPNGKYTFEPESGAVYLVLTEEDLSTLSKLKKSRSTKD